MQFCRTKSPEKNKMKMMFLFAGKLDWTLNVHGTASSVNICLVNSYRLIFMFTMCDPGILRVHLGTYPWYVYLSPIQRKLNILQGCRL